MGLLPKNVWPWAVVTPLPLTDHWKEIKTPTGDQILPANLIVNILNEGLVVGNRQEYSNTSVLCVWRATEARVPQPGQQGWLGDVVLKCGS